MASVTLGPELVDRVLKYTWLGDGITDAENDTLSVLYSFAERGGVEATKQVMDYQWLAEGVAREEYDLIAELARLVEDDPEAARRSVVTLVPYPSPSPPSRLQITRGWPTARKLRAIRNRSHCRA